LWLDALCRVLIYDALLYALLYALHLRRIPIYTHWTQLRIRIVTSWFGINSSLSLAVGGAVCYHPVFKMQTAKALSISEKLRQRFSHARRVLVLTGAGISAESGVPTFRGGGNTAVWKGMPFDVISSAAMVQRDLSAVWEWFDYRRALLASLQPNPAHREIARWQHRFQDFALVTQNIDSLHQRAGSQDVIELHGNIWRARCISCEVLYEIPQTGTRPAACLECGDCLRPDVVLFGERLPPGAFERAAERATECELCIVVGTSALVYPAANLPEIARAQGAYLCEVNPERTPLSGYCDEVLTGKAGEILPLLNEIESRELSES
jgi:NAD-dependent deacetylase